MKLPRTHEELTAFILEHSGRKIPIIAEIGSPAPAGHFRANINSYAWVLGVLLHYPKHVKVVPSSTNLAILHDPMQNKKTLSVIIYAYDVCIGIFYPGSAIDIVAPNAHEDIKDLHGDIYNEALTYI